jgi:hypothetical protein
MAEYPGVEHERRFPHETLHGLVHAIFERCGMAEADAGLLADQLVKADLRGIHSHGVMRVPLYVSKLTKGEVDPRGRPRVTKDAAAALVVDGGNNMGQIAGVFAMQADRARPHDERRGRRGRQQQPRRRHGVLRAHGDRGRHDRHRHHERAADHGALGRHRQAGRAQPDRHRHPGGRGSAFKEGEHAE